VSAGHERVVTTDLFTGPAHDLLERVIGGGQEPAGRVWGPGMREGVGVFYMLQCRPDQGAKR
jgi:hypothetical protein